MEVGSKIKEARKKKGITQDELAHRIGISKNGLWNYENNKRQVNLDQLNKIAIALDIEVIELIGKENYINEAKKQSEAILGEFSKGNFIEFNNETNLLMNLIQYFNEEYYSSKYDLQKVKTDDILQVKNISLSVIEEVLKRL